MIKLGILPNSVSCPERTTSSENGELILVQIQETYSVSFKLGNVQDSKLRVQNQTLRVSQPEGIKRRGEKHSDNEYFIWFDMFMFRKFEQIQETSVIRCRFSSLEGWGGSRPKWTRTTSHFSTIPDSSADSTPRRDQLRSEM